MTTYKPHQNYILISPEKQPEKIGRIYIPQLYAENINEGQILDIGPDCTSELKKGDRVIFTRNSEYRFEDEDEKGVEYICVQETNIILCKPASKEDPNQGKLFEGDTKLVLNETYCAVHAARYTRGSKCPHCVADYERDMNSQRRS